MRVACGTFKRWAPDLIVCQTNPQSEDGAISVACTAARTLQFMAATGLKPSKSDVLPGGGGTGRLPGRDHCSSWFDPATKRKIILDEPYAAAVADRQQERDAWAERNNWQIVKSAWGGIYFPDGGCELYLLADRKKGGDLESIEAVLSALGTPVVPENCRRIATKDGEPFRTPGEIQLEAEKSARASMPKTARVVEKASNTVRYKMLFSSGARPNAKMPIERHSEVEGFSKKSLRLPVAGQASPSVSIWSGPNSITGYNSNMIARPFQTASFSIFIITRGLRFLTPSVVSWGASSTSNGYRAPRLFS